MAPSRTRTIKNKHAAGKAGSSGKKSARKPQSDGIVKSRKSKSGPSTQIRGRTNISDPMKKKKKRVYTEKELGIPQLNSIVPVGVEKPKGKKKGKVFVDDRESMATILAMVQAEKEGQIESKIMKARQMEEIREARRLEAEKKEEERKAKLEETKDSLRKKRKRHRVGDDSEVSIKDVTAAGTKAAKPSKRRVTFAE